MPDIPLVIRNKPHNNQLCTDLFRFISAYPVVSHFLRFAWQTTETLDKKLFLNPEKARRYIFREVMDIVLNSYGEEGYQVYASKLTAEEKEIMGI